jgi:N-acetylglutamate synthase-like GNAT family acetyltransferase
MPYLQKGNYVVELHLMTAGITFRQARKSDRKQIWRLVWDARLNPFGLNWRRFVVGVNSAGEVIACVQIKPHQDGSKELASLVVAPDSRGQGIARLILEQLFQDYRDDLYLMCRASLGTFYRKFGFEIPMLDELPPYFSRISKLASFFRYSRDPESGLLIMKR